MSHSKTNQSPEASEIANWVRPAATFESFCWEDAPSLDRNLFLTLATCTFITDRQNVIFSGPTASGKSHLSNVLSDIALRAGHSVNHVDGSRLDARFSWQAFQERYLVDCDLLIVDDPHPTEQLRAILKERRGRSTLLLTTAPATELLTALIPPTVSLEPLRDAWTTPIVVEFKENSHGLKLRGQN